MNFFEHQDQAQKRTKELVLLFILATVLMTAVITALAAGLVYVAETKDKRTPQPQLNADFLARNLGLLGFASLGTLGLIGFGSLSKTMALRAGGGAVAKDLGGTLLSPEEREFKRRRLMNIVEEMAVASGVPVPEVYVLEKEEGINAFAAGFSPGDAAIGVTQGTLDLLNRDELQGVIAHEFSHILNGDMRLNMKLLGVLHGILLIAIAGQMLFRSTMYSQMFRGRRDRDSGGMVAAMFLLGLGIMIVGSVGLFFGRLIKAAVSRQREYLADASAVQFTRNPEGIAGALKKIGGFTKGSKLAAPKAEEVSHMLFGGGMQFMLPGLSTHPPIVDRIKRLDPQFNPKEMEQYRDMKPLPQEERAAGFAGGSPKQKVTMSADDVVSRVGNPSPEGVLQAAGVLGALSGEVRESGLSLDQSMATVFALLLGGGEAVMTEQGRIIERAFGSEMAAHTRDMFKQVQNLDREHRLAAADVAFPALKRQPPAQGERFLTTVDQLIAADGKVDLFEFVLSRILRTHLTDAYVPRRGEGRRKLSQTADHAEVLVSLVAVVGNRDKQQAQAAMMAGLQALGIEPSRRRLPPDDWMEATDKALDTLDQLALREKERLVRGLVQAVVNDGVVTASEADLLRAVCESLHCPLPSLAA